MLALKCLRLISFFSKASNSASQGRSKFKVLLLCSLSKNSKPWLSHLQAMDISEEYRLQVFRRNVIGTMVYYIYELPWHVPRFHVLLKQIEIKLSPISSVISTRYCLP